MPVETRSQRKSVNNLKKSTLNKDVSNKDVSNKDVSNKDVSNKEPIVKANIVLNIQEKQTTIVDWFIVIVNRYAEKIFSLQTKKEISYDNSNKHRKYHYDQVRLVTECYYIIQEYFPEVSDTKYGKLLANTFYTQSQSFDHQIRTNKVISRNAEEYQTVRVALRQLQDTAKMLIPYLEIQPIKNKRFPTVDYTGMDSIFVDEYDGITDIWEDTKVVEDPDYELEE